MFFWPVWLSVGLGRVNMSSIRGLKQRPRRVRKGERQKKKKLRASGFFVHFFAVTAQKCQISRFVKDKTSDEEIFLPLFKL